MAPRPADPPYRLGAIVGAGAWLAGLCLNALLSPFGFRPDPVLTSAFRTVPETIANQVLYYNGTITTFGPEVLVPGLALAVGGHQIASAVRGGPKAGATVAVGYVAATLLTVFASFGLLGPWEGSTGGLLLAILLSAAFATPVAAGAGALGGWIYDRRTPERAEPDRRSGQPKRQPRGNRRDRSDTDPPGRPFGVSDPEEKPEFTTHDDGPSTTSGGDDRQFDRETN